MIPVLSPKHVNVRVCYLTSASLTQNSCNIQAKAHNHLYLLNKYSENMTYTLVFLLIFLYKHW